VSSLVMRMLTMNHSVHMQAMCAHMVHTSSDSYHTFNIHGRQLKP
jgi:hypothetical protein